MWWWKSNTSVAGYHCLRNADRLVCDLWCSPVVSLIWTNVIYILPTPRCLFFSFTGSWREGREKQSEKPHIFSEVFMGGTWSRPTSVRNAVFLSCVRGVRTLPGGFCTKKRHVMTNFIIKCLFPKIAVFNFSFTLCYMISVVYDS